MSANVSTTLWPPEEQTAEAEEAGTDRQKVDAPRKNGSADDTGVDRVAKRKATTAARNRKRNKKMMREEANAEIVGQYWNQSGLQLVVEEDIYSQANDRTIPWEHRGVLGQTRGQA